MTEVDLSWFVPFEKQAEFLHATTRESAYIGGRGAGKTLVGAVRASLMALQYPGSVGLVGRQTSERLRDTTMKIMLEGEKYPPTVPESLIRSFNKTEKRLDLVNGSTILFRHFQDHSPEQSKGHNLSWFWLDEASESSEFIWITISAGMRGSPPGRAWITSNPNGHDWMWRRFHPDAGQNLEKDGSPRSLTVATSDDNPTLGKDFFDFLDSLPEEVQRRERYASFDTAAGQIFDEWDPQVHVVDDVDLPRDWGFVESIDHGERNPTAWLLGRIDGDGNVWIEREYYQPNRRTSDHIVAISEIRNSFGLQTRRPIADPSMFASRMEGTSPADMYAKAGIRLVPGENRRDATYSMVRDYLHRDGALLPPLHQLGGTLGPKGKGVGAPRLFVLRRCANLIRELPEYVWKDYSPAIRESRETPEEPRKMNDHAVDALRYMIASQPKVRAEHVFREPPKPERRRAQTAGVRTRTF